MTAFHDLSMTQLVYTWSTTLHDIDAAQAHYDSLGEARAVEDAGRRLRALRDTEQIIRDEVERRISR